MPARKTKSKPKEKKKTFQVEVKEVGPAEEKVLEEKVAPIENVKILGSEEHPIDEDPSSSFDKTQDSSGQVQETDKEEIDEEGASFKKIIFWTLGILCAITLLVASGYFVYQEGVRRGEDNSEAKMAQTTPTVVPSSTPKEIKASAYTIKVLNGSGVSGEAGTVKSLLEKEEYSVSSIGNADNSKYEETVIKVKKTVEKAWIEKLKSVLSKSYQLSDPETLSEDEGVDVMVTVGSKKAE